MSQCEAGQWKLLTSTALALELDQIPDLERLRNVKAILAMAKIKVVCSQEIEVRARELQQLGFSGYDAAHIASAERGRADVFLSTDDRLVRRAQHHAQVIQVVVNNPVQWLMQSTQVEDENNV